MNKLSLSMPRRKALPESVTVDGVEYPVRAGFRTQLKIIRLLESDEIAERHKPGIVGRLFFGQNAPENALELWREWMQGRELERDPEAPEMSYEDDAGDIYASFLAQYGIDLLDEGTALHWYQFTALLNGLGDESPLKRTLALRGLDTSALKGKARTKAERAKRNARLPERESGEDRKLRDQLNELLKRGGDPGEVLGKR